MLHFKLLRNTLQKFRNFVIRFSFCLFFYLNILSAKSTFEVILSYCLKTKKKIVSFTPYKKKLKKTLHKIIEINQNLGNLVYNRLLQPLKVKSTQEEEAAEKALKVKVFYIYENTKMTDVL